MCLACRAKLGLDTEMNLQVAPLEPTAAALREIGRFGSYLLAADEFMVSNIVYIGA